MSSKWMFWKKRRYHVAVLAFYGFVNISSFRIYQNTALFPMLVSETGTDDSGRWNRDTIKDATGAFFYGLISTHLFGGWLSAKIGGKAVFGGGITVLTILTFLTPWLAKINVYFLFAVQILQGIFQGLTYPAIFALWSKWAPSLERTILVNIAFTGIPMGLFLSVLVCPYLVKRYGPEITFCMCGGNGLVWCIIWWWIIKDSPANDPKISREELEYIQKSTGDDERQPITIQLWIKIFTSGPVWALIVADFALSWGIYSLLGLPVFVYDAFKLDLYENNLMPILRYLLMVILTLISGLVADWLLEKKILTTIQVRKLFTCGGLLAQAAFILVIGFSTSVGIILICTIFAAGLGMCACSAYRVNSLDIAPKHASLIMGISQTFATLSNMFGHKAYTWVAAIAYDKRFKIYYCCGSVLLVFASVVYGICASGETQSWSLDRKIPKEGAAEAEQTELGSPEGHQ